MTGIRSVVFSAVLLLIAGRELQAQDRRLGEFDSRCANGCAAIGYAAEYCNRVCWIPDRPRTLPQELTDWACMSTCSDRGGTYAECKPRCRLP